MICRFDLFQKMVAFGILPVLILFSSPVASTEQFNWFGLNDLRSSSLSAEEQLAVTTMSAGVVRLHHPMALGPNGGNSSRGNIGCTAWRASVDLFATAWHCLFLRDQDSCDIASITFDYEPPERSTGGQFDSADWGSASEECERIVYSNDRLDFALFRVTTEQIGIWGGTTPILRVLPGDDSFPQTTTPGLRTGDRFVVLHHPRPSACIDIHTLEKVNAVAEGDSFYVRSGGYQMSLRISAFDDAETNNQCRAWIPQTGTNQGEATLNRPTRQNPEPTIRAVLGRHPDPGGSFRLFNSPVLPEELPSIALLHRCGVCAGSSGAPIGSLEPGPRHGTVVGIQSYYYASESEGNDGPPYAGYGGTRMSVIAQCLDMHAMSLVNELGPNGEGAELVYAEGAAEHAVCDPLIATEDVPYLECNESTRHQADCEFYVQ